jgi:hypothetical protein
LIVASPASIIWHNEDAMASPLLASYIDVFGMEVDPVTEKSPLQWDPLTIRAELLEVAGKPVSDSVFDRLMAGIAIMTSDRFYVNSSDFIPLANVLSGSPADEDVFDFADAAECLWAVTEARLINDDERYGPEVAGYIAQVYTAEGFSTIPDIIKPIAVEGGWTGVPPPVGYDDQLFAQVTQVQSDKLKELRDWWGARLRTCAQQFYSINFQNGKQVTPEKFSQLFSR